MPAPVPRGCRREIKVQHDRKNHRLKITTAEGQTAQFDDRPIRFLVMVPDQKTKALQPVIMSGEPLYYYLSPEVGQ